MNKKEHNTQLTKEFADFCYSLDYKGLPAKIIDLAKYYFLDFAACTLRGSLEEPSKKVSAFIAEMNCPTGPSVVIGTDIKTLSPFAALANGVSSHCIDMEDISNKASVHPGSVIYPAALAAGELTHCSGKRFIEGVVAGYEVMCKLGMLHKPPGLYKRGFYPTGLCGVFGAAAAVSKILGLDGCQIKNALGIAGSQSSGLMEFANTGGWTLRFHTGWPAHSGIIAALIASQGFKGPSAILEGDKGFMKVFSPGFETNNVSLMLGDPYEITEISVKPYASARYENGPIEAIIKIVKENNIQPQQVIRVVIGMLKSGWDIVCLPDGKKRNPRTSDEASCSMFFGAAVAIVNGKVTPDEYSASNLESAEIRELISKVVCVEDSDLDKMYPGQWPAWVKIEIDNGEVLSSRVDNPKGDFRNPLSWDELVLKYEELSHCIFPESKRKEILHRIRNIEQEGDMAEFSSILVKKS